MADPSLLAGLANVFLDFKASLLGTPSDALEPRARLCIQASKQYRAVLQGHPLLPLWHLTENLFLRAQSCIGASSELTTLEFSWSLAAFLAKYRRRPHPALVHYLLYREYEPVVPGLPAPPADLRSRLIYRADWNRWRQVLLSMASLDEDCKRVLSGYRLEDVISKYELDWFEQLVLRVLYDDTFVLNDWQDLYTFVATINPDKEDPLRHILTGNILSLIAHVSERYPPDAAWFGGHLMDLLYLDTRPWLDPALDIPEPLDRFLLSKHAKGLMANDSTWPLALEYLCYCGSEAVVNVQEAILRKADFTKPATWQLVLDRCRNVFDDGFMRQLYQPAIDQLLQSSNPQRALILALQSGIPLLVDSVACALLQAPVNSDGFLNIPIEPDLLDTTPYPILQLALNFNEFKRLAQDNTQLEEAALLLSAMILHAHVPRSFYPALLKEAMVFLDRTRLCQNVIIRLLDSLEVLGEQSSQLQNIYRRKLISLY